MQGEDAASAHALRSVRLLFEAYAGSELPQWDLLASNVRTVRLEPGAVLFPVGEVHPYAYFVQHGLLKAQQPMPGGRLATIFFSEDGDTLAALTALGMEGVRRTVARGLHPRSSALRPVVAGVTTMQVTAIEQSLLMRVAFRVIDHLASQHIAWSKAITSMAVMYATSMQADINWLRSTPEQRYRSFLAERSDLVARLTQRDLANYLNVTDVALSRIAKRVRGEAGGHSADLCADDLAGQNLRR